MCSHRSFTYNVDAITSVSQHQAPALSQALKNITLQSSLLLHKEGIPAPNFKGKATEAQKGSVHPRS